MSKRQRSALHDCTEQINDSVEQLRRSLHELQHLRSETFQWQMSNAQTWVSAALTDGDTCLDGFAGNARPDVKRRVTDSARVTSNALFMINMLGQSGKPKPKPKPRVWVSRTEKVRIDRDYCTVRIIMSWVWDGNNIWLSVRVTVMSC